MDTHTPIGKLMLTVLGGTVRTRDDVREPARRRRQGGGQIKGGKPITSEFRKVVLQLAMLGTTKASIARQLNLGEAIVYRILAAAKAAESG